MSGSTTYYQAALWKAGFEPDQTAEQYNAMIKAVHEIVVSERNAAFEKAIRTIEGLKDE